MGYSRTYQGRQARKQALASKGHYVPYSGAIRRQNAPQDVTGDFDDIGRGDIAGKYHYSQKRNKGQF